jgi:predicted Fe-Mo cluster-binding NifX family protein
MMVAITSTGQTLDDQLDERFGRARFFLILNTETGELRAVDNVQNLQAPQGAGIQAAKTVIDQGAEVVITGHCGPNAFQTLQAAGIKVVVGAQGTVGQVLEKFNKGELKHSSAADVPGHWS